MAHNVLIVLHALAGIACFATGVLSLGLTTARSWRFRAFLVSLGGLLAFLATAVIVDWPELDTSTRLVYLGLFGLGVYMAWRAARANARLRHQEPGWRPAYLDDVGFNLISLFDGFVIVAAIDLGAPGWLVALVAVAGVAGGLAAMSRVKARLGTAPASP